jgi:hypothetical protein
MSKHPSKRRAIQNALGRLGWQVHSKDVIALLADYGIEVSERLVSRVRIDSLKKLDESKMRQAKIDQMARQRRTKGVSKLPQRRTYYRSSGPRAG